MKKIEAEGDIEEGMLLKSECPTVYYFVESINDDVISVIRREEDESLVSFDVIYHFDFKGVDDLSGLFICEDDREIVATFEAARKTLAELHGFLRTWGHKRRYAQQRIDAARLA